MRVSKTIDTLIVFICLPFYAVAFPLLAISTRFKLNHIRKTACPSCGASLASLQRSDIVSCAAKLTLAHGARVDWDRLPMTKVACPVCRHPIFYDRKLRPTSGDYSAHIQRTLAKNAAPYP